MKLRATTYTFDASAQTVDCALFTSLEAIQLIVNVTDQIIIYNFADTTKGGTLSSTTLTLEYDTTTMDDTDKLMIIVEDGTTTTAISAASLPLPTGAATSAKQDTIIGHVDGIETLIGTTNSTLTTIDGRVDGVEALLTTLAGAVAGTEIQADVLTVPADPFGANADAAATAGSTGSIQAKLRLMTSQLDSIKTALETIDNSIAGSETQVDVVTLPGVTGNAASGATDSGNPVKMGGVYNSTQPTFTDGQRGDLQIGTRGELKVNIYNGTQAIAFGADNADDVSPSADNSRIQVLTRNTVYDGTNWDRMRGDATDGVLVNLGSNNDVLVGNAFSSPVYTHATSSGLVSERITNTDGTSTAFSNFTNTASTYNYVKSISVYNSSATAGYIDFRDGTAGSVLWTVPLPAGGGAVISSETPLFRTSANTALAYDVSAALSTVYISISGYRSTS